MAEILVLRQQINVLRRYSPKRSVFRPCDRLLFVGLYPLTPSIVDMLAIVRPETVVRWHRAGFRSFWRWKSRRCGGRPSVPLEIRGLIRDMSLAKPLWGAPRIYDGVTSFAALQDTLLRGQGGRLTYYIFDLLHLDGRDLTGLPLIERKALLQPLLAGLSKEGPVRYTSHVEGQGPKFFTQAGKLGPEGIVSKRAGRPTARAVRRIG